MNEVPSEHTIRAILGGSVSHSQIAIGNDITQSHITEISHNQVSAAELQTLQQAFSILRAEIEHQALPEQQVAALEKVKELEAAITAPKPKLPTMEYVRDWFVDHLPALSGAVTSVVVNPIVGKIVEAAGDTLAEEFRRRFKLS